MIAASVFGLAPWAVVLALAIVFVGAATQASIGVGLGLLAAPTLGLLDESFIPGALSMSLIPLVAGMAWRERRHIDPTVYRAVPGRLIGSVAGAFVVATAGRHVVAIVIGCAVMIAVLASFTRIHFAPSRRNMIVAGTASGFSGTIATVGGPPMAITYQHSDPEVLRGSLAVFNTIGLLLFTLPSLAIAGVIGRREIELALMLVPAVVAGLWIGKYLIARLPAAHVRLFVLGVCAASAVVLIIREVL